MPIPPDTRAPGDAGHVGDHNNIADELTALVAADTLAAAKSANLADLASASTARTNLGLTGAATATLPLSAANGGTGSSTRNFAGLLTPTAVKTTAYTAVAGDFVPVDTTSGTVTVTLPNAPADLTVVAVKHVIQGGTNVVTFACAGTDVFNKTGGGTTGTLTLLAQGAVLQYKASGGIWYVTADDLPLSQLDARYTLRPLAAEATYYVSAAASASDSNDGLTVRSAKATIAGALTAAGAAACRIIVGAGTFTISAADTGGNAVTLPYAGTILQGQGVNRTIISVSTTVTFGIQAQAAYCEVRDLAVYATTGGTVTYGVAVDTPTGTGSAEHCNFRDILVQPVSSGVITNCFAVAPSHTGASAVDVAETVFTRCIAVGAANAGFLVGNGTAGNILNSTFTDCYVSSCVYGLYAVQTTFTWTGGTIQKSSNTDFYLSATKRADIGGFRSENSTRLLVSPAAGGTNNVAVRDVIWIGGDGLSGRPAQSAAGDFINYAQGGSLLLDNVQIQAVNSSGVVPCFILASGGSGTAPLAVVTNCLAAEAPVNQLFSIANGKPCTVTVAGYVQLSNTTGVAVTSTTPVNAVLVASSTTFSFNGTVRNVMIPAAATVTAPDIQYFTTVGTATWTKPAGAVTTEAFVISGGAGGGSGRRGAAGSVRCGGGGGAGATLVSRKFATADLSSTVTVTVGDGGAGGAAVTADDTSGNSGSLGGSSSFGTYLAGPLVTGGVGGTAALGTGGTGSLGGPGTAGAGGSASTTGGAGVGVTSAMIGAAGAPSGGGITSADAAGAGAAGNYSYLGGNSSSTFGTAGVVDSTAPAAGTSSGVKGTPGGSPGSGAASKTTAAQAGAAAYANSGAGGAGGGASLNGNNSGAGGKGGSGFVLVVSLFQ